MTESHDEKEEMMAFPIAISVLSQITSMSSTETLERMKEPFHEIMVDFNVKKER